MTRQSAWMVLLLVGCGASANDGSGVVGNDDPTGTGRPVRLTLSSNPKDGDLVSLWEMGGYWHEPLTEAQWQAMCEPYGPSVKDE